MTTEIEWARNADGTKGETWNPTTGCDRVSPGCDNCYALKLAGRLKRMGQAKYQRDGDPRTSGPGFRLTLHPDALDIPLRRKKPTTFFVDSMSDLFHPEVPNEFIVDVLGVMTLAPHHTYQVLTKRPHRMASLLSDPQIPGMVAQAADRLDVARAVAAMGPERMVEIPGYPGYVVTDRGRVLLEGGSDACLWCGEPLSEARIARSKFCTQRCNSKAHYEKMQGRWAEPETFRELRPDIGDQGHRRITMIGGDGEKHREQVHRLVLGAFRGPPRGEAQACHRDGDPSNNALPNLRWGTQQENWADRHRHGNERSWSRLSVQDVQEIRKGHAAGLSNSYLSERFGVSDTQIRNIVRGDQWAARSDWPLPSLWAGTSIENDRYTWRADHLRNTPAAIRFLSLEPLIGPVPSLDLDGIDWVIVGGESGPHARPMHPDWVRNIRDRCATAGIPFFFKQWGAWRPGLANTPGSASPLNHGYFCADGRWLSGTGNRATSAPNTREHIARVGKANAGRLLDGRTWDEMPEHAGVVA
jgi:protein gp37